MWPVIAGVAIVGGLVAWALSESADSERRQWERDAEHIRREMQAYSAHIEAQRAQARRAEQRESLRRAHAAACKVADAAYQRVQKAREHRRKLLAARDQLTVALQPVPAWEWAGYSDERQRECRTRQTELRRSRNALDALIRRMHGQIDGLYAELKAFNARTASLRDALAAA